MVIKVVILTTNSYLKFHLVCACIRGGITKHHTLLSAYCNCKFQHGSAHSMDMRIKRDRMCLK